MKKHTMSGDRRSVSTVVSWVVLLAFLATAVLPLPALAGDAVFYYHNDPTGSPVAITDAAGTKVWGADYEPFGEIAGLVENVPNNQQFLAKTVDPETSLHLLGARYYDGKLGRFLSVDPALLKGQPDSAVQYPQRLNLYTYVGNNPYKHTDSTGRFLETAFDLVSFGLSLQGFKSDPSVMNGLALAYDTFALAVPLLPAGAGIIVKSAGGLEKAVDVGGAARGGENVSNIARNTDSASGIARGAEPTAAANRAENIARGIPASELGPSGKPKIHVVEHATKKEAKDAARAEVGAGGTTVKHANPEVGESHFHGVTQSGEKARVHHEY